MSAEFKNIIHCDLKWNVNYIMHIVILLNLRIKLFLVKQYMFDYAGQLLIALWKRPRNAYKLSIKNASLILLMINIFPLLKNLLSKCNHINIMLIPSNLHSSVVPDTSLQIIVSPAMLDSTLNERFDMNGGVFDSNTVLNSGQSDTGSRALTVLS